MNQAEHWVTLVLLAGIVLLVITHPGGFATDLGAGGSVLDNTVGAISGAGVTAGVNYPTGTPPANLAA